MDIVCAALSMLPRLHSFTSVNSFESCPADRNVIHGFAPLGLCPALRYLRVQQHAVNIEQDLLPFVRHVPLEALDLCTIFLRGCLHHLLQITWNLVYLTLEACGLRDEDSPVLRELLTMNPGTYLILQTTLPPPFTS